MRKSLGSQESAVPLSPIRHQTGKKRKKKKEERKKDADNAENIEMKRKWKMEGWRLSALQNNEVWLELIQRLDKILILNNLSI